MDVADDTTKVWADKIDKEHRARARTLSELAAKLIMKRKAQLPRNFDEWCQDMDIIKRAHEHVGACNAMNEIKVALFPSPVAPAPAVQPSSGTVGQVPPPPAAALVPAPPTLGPPAEVPMTMEITPSPPAPVMVVPPPPPPVLPTPSKLKEDPGDLEQRG